MKTTITGNRILSGGNVSVEIKNLNKINILFGKNGTGKSSFLRHVYQSDAENYHLVVPERGGAELQYSSGMLDQENNPQNKKNARVRNYDNSYRNRAISRASGILFSKGRESLRGLSSDDIRDEDITYLFRIFLPEFRVAFADKAPFDLEIYRETNDQETKVANADQLSSGQAEALSLAADIVTQGVLWNNDPEKILLIDEPDAHLHIDLQNRFAIFINEISKKFDVQVIIATHSPGLISALLSLTEDISVVCFDNKNSSVSAIKKDEKLIFANLLSTDISLAVLLKRKIVIVEGNDDFLVWNQAARSQTFTDISLIQANGGDILKYKKNAESILTTILDAQGRSGLVICDRDRKGDYENKDGDALPVERLSCYSLENLLLSKEVLSFIDENLDLNVSLGLLKNEVNITIEEQGEIDAIIQDKKNTKISKELIKKIHSYIDGFSVSRDWRVVLGKVIGKEKPTGELADFLGQATVDYLWEELPKENEN